MSKLSTLICHTPNYWNNISPILQQKAQRIQSDGFHIYGCRSRSISDIVSYVFGGWYTRNAQAIRLLATLCALLANEKKLKLTAVYKTISSNEADGVTLYTLKNEIYTVEDDKINLCFYHIPKGKSYAKQILENNANELTELTSIEQYCKQYPTEFLKIYKGFARQNDIVIFTEKPTAQMVLTLLTMLPHLYDIKINENEPENSEYNIKVTKLFNIFAKLFSIRETIDTQTHSFTENDCLWIIAWTKYPIHFVLNDFWLSTIVRCNNC